MVWFPSILDGNNYWSQTLLKSSLGTWHCTTYYWHCTAASKGDVCACIAHKLRLCFTGSVSPWTKLGQPDFSASKQRCRESKQPYSIESIGYIGSVARGFKVKHKMFTGPICFSKKSIEGGCCGCCHLGTIPKCFHFHGKKSCSPYPFCDKSRKSLVPKMT